MNNRIEKSLAKLPTLSFFTNMQISQKLIICFLTVSLVPILIVGLMSYFNYRRAITRQIGQYSLNELTQTAANVELVMKEFETISIQLFINKSFLQAIDDLEQASVANEQQKNAVSSYFENYMISNPDIFSFVYISNQGSPNTVVVAKDYSADLKRYLNRLKTTPYYRSILQKTGSMSWSPVFNIENAHFVMLTRAVKSQQNGQITGVFGIVIDEEKFDKIVNSYLYNKMDFSLDDVSHFSVIIDTDGIIVSSPFKQDIGKSIDELMHRTGQIKKMMTETSDRDNASDERQGNLIDSVYKHQALVTYKKVGMIVKNPWTVISFAYTSKIFEAADQNGLLTLLLGLIAATCAILLSIRVALGISRPLNQVVTAMQKAEKGDLTAKVTVFSQDELGILGGSFNEMIAKIRALIVDTKVATDDLVKKSLIINETSEQSAHTANHIAVAMNGISQGSLNQSMQAENTSKKMKALADGIEKVISFSNEIQKMAALTKELTMNSDAAVEFLIQKANETGNITREINGNIRELTDSTKEIAGFTTLIADIADQTTLLAFNASIEAARAGELGRGFEVVAQNVNALSVKSNRAALSINELLQMIFKKTTLSTNTADQARQIVNDQITAVDNAQESFQQIIQTMDHTLQRIEELNAIVDEIKYLKNESVSAITNISSICEDSAASVQEVLAATEEQNANSKEANGMAEDLQRLAAKLVKAVSNFNLNSDVHV